LCVRRCAHRRRGLYRPALAMMDKTFVATAGPEGWALGRWSPLSSILWEEKRPDGSVAQWADCGESKTQGSHTVRLKGQLDGQLAEILILDTSIQIITDGSYHGEYLGRWEGAAAPVPPAPVPVARASLRGSDSPQAPKGVAKLRPQKKHNCINRPDMVEKLYLACKAGNDFDVHKYLEAPVDPDGISPSSERTPLMGATEGGSVRCAELLLQYGADVNKDVGGLTAMILAHQKGKKDVLRLLFGAAFQSLECIVGGGGGQSAGVRKRPQDDDIDSGLQHRNLRDVTAKLASLNARESGQKDVETLSAYDDQMSQYSADDQDHDRMREEVVRETMRALLNASRSENR